MSTKYDERTADEELRAARAPDYLLGFLRALTTANLLGDDVVYFLSRPEKWSPEFALWMDHNCPEFDDDPTFDAWVAAVEARDV
jgi:hypothetical protein